MARIRARALLRTSLAVAALTAILWLPHTSGWAALGSRANGERLARMEHSSHWSGGRFVNFQEIRNNLLGSLTTLFHPSPYATPSSPVAVVHPDPALFATPPPSGLRVTWFGHSSTLVEIDGVRVLTDPVWSEHASPIGWLGPKRYYPPPLALSDLPPIDAVLISHDHYDHLDYGTLVAMRGWKTRFVVPLGVGADLALWGIPADRIVEVDWWDHVRVGDIDLVCTPSRHASGRVLVDRDAKLWSGYALLGPRNRLYYSGDSGLFPGLQEIGERLGPFDLTMIEIGQYDRAWPDWHMGPEQAVHAHQMVRGRAMLPVHWGALTLAAHGWTEPIERALVAARAAGVILVAPRPGQSIEPSAPPPLEHWWPDLPWSTAAEDPIVSTQN